MLNKFNSLRSKMLVTAGAGLLLVFALLFIAARTVLVDGFTRLEQDKTNIQLRSAVSLIEDQYSQLGASASDNAVWDDMYEYVAAPYQKFIDSSFSTEIYSSLKINAIFIVNNQGDVLHERGYDYINSKPWRIPDFLRQAAFKNGALSNPDKEEIAGLLWTPQGICIVTSHSIFDSKKSKPTRGKLIMARLLTSETTRKLEKTLGTIVNVEAYRTDELETISPLLITNDSAVIPLNDKQIVGYAKLEDIGGNTNILLKVFSDRKIYAQGKSSLQFFYWSLAVIGLILAIFSWVFNKFIIARIANLDQCVKMIDASKSTLRIAETDSKDEINSLAQGINGMLARLDESQLALQFEKERAQVTLSSIADAVITSDNQGNVIFMNEAAERLTGLASTYASGKPLQDLFTFTTADKTTKVNSAWLTNASSVVDEVMLTHPNGEEFIISKSASALHDANNQAFGTVSVLHDVTLVRMMSNKLSQQARFDALTGLANRYEFDRKAQSALDDTLSTSQNHCIAYIDLDKFKLVNDSCGHLAGDLFLKQLAEYLQTKIRSADMLARLGGDEFALILMACKLDKAKQIVGDLLKVIKNFKFEYDNKVFKVGASIGLIEISPKHAMTLTELLATADSACYTAKHDGGNCVRVYQANENNLQEKHQLLNWVTRINHGLENNQFVLYSQPVQGLYKNAEPHCELLIRMKGEDGMLHPPSMFLPAAENYHLMPQIDRWVVNEALAIISAKGIKAAGVYGINLSGQSLSQDDFLEYVLDKLTEYKINTHRICFEITETTVISNLDKARHFMQVLRAKGCRFSLDDFGSGLSSFAYLKNLEVDYLKIDGMFVKNIVTNNIDRAMVESIHKVGHVMGLKTIAEFAENQEIIDVLREIGIDYAQGYGVAMPVLFE